MKEIELLEHMLENRKAGRAAGHGLLLNGEASRATNIFGMGLYEGYSLAPRTHGVNGFTVPAPETDELTIGSAYYLCNVANPCWVSTSRWLHSEFDLRLLRRGSVFLDREAAIANAKAEKGIDPYSEGEE